MTGRLIPQHDLTSWQRGAMRELLASHFDGVTDEQFDRDLAQKNWVIWLSDERGHLCGFSTLLVYTDAVGNERSTIVYSGDTLVAPAARRSTSLMRTWVSAVSQLAAEGRSSRVFWLLITSGFRTYRFLPLFCRHFFPRYDVTTPPAVQADMARLAASRFGEAYDQSRGIVRFLHPQPLRGDFARIPPGRLADPHIAFFSRANPGHAEGDELVCLAQLGEAGLTPAGLRMLRVGVMPLQPELLKS